MAKKVVTLYVDDNSLRLLVVQGKRIRKWADSPLEPGLVKSNVVINEAEVAARVKQLFKTQKVREKKVIIGLSGLHCLTRPIGLPAIPRAMLGEAVIREARRVLPVPPDQLYISWQILPALDGKLQLFMVAVPCKIADPLIKMLHQAGLKPYLMDLKPLALARAVKETTAVIVDVQSAEFDIVIMAYGIPQPIRSVSLPSETLSPQEKWLKVKEELDRTIKFYNSNNPEKPLGPDVPIFVSGELANPAGLSRSLYSEFSLSALTLPPSLKRPEQLDPTRYMVNIGLALKEQASGKGSGTSIVNVNSLPIPYRPKPVPLIKIVALPTAVAIIGLIFMLTTFIRDVSANVDSVRHQLESTNKTLTQKQQKKQELTKTVAELEKKLAGTQAARDTFTAMVSSLYNNQEKINGDLQVVTSRLPGSISLNAISQSLDILTVMGRSPDETEVLAYARSLESSGRFSEITVASISRVRTGEEMDFVLSIKTKVKG